MSNVLKFRKKPVVIEAILWDGGSTALLNIAEFLGKDQSEWLNTDRTISIETLEGTMLANRGDYIIKGVQGEFYPCKPDIFNQTYEEVTDNE